MTRKRKTKGPKPPPAVQARPPLDPDTGLPPVVRRPTTTPSDQDRVLRRARAKHAHRQGYHR